jgi:muconolactone delta-isomerase
MDKLKLTPAEMNIVKYHRDTIKSGKVGSDSEGRPITVYSTGILVPEGPMKGKFVSVPGYVKGTTKWTEGQLYEIWKEDIQSGKWPTYQSSQELNKRSQEIHSIMDNEAPEAVQSREKAMPPRMQSRQLLKDLETPQWQK